MLMVFSLEAKASFKEMRLLLLELMSLLQELSMHLSISILRCRCSHLNFTGSCKIFLLEVKPSVGHLCLKMRLHMSQMSSEVGLLLLYIMVEVLFSLHGEFIPEGSRNLLQLSAPINPSSLRQWRINLD